ncbi:MAG: DNA gyrase subunit A [Saprospiraceae bacterium]|jgi:DNA gyrase subunit A
MITTKNGIVIRLHADEFRVMGRATQGVRVINVDKKDSISDLAVIADARNDEEEEE